MTATVFTIEKTAKILTIMREGLSFSDAMKIASEHHDSKWAGTAEMLILKHKTLADDEAMAIAIEYNEPNWLTRPRAETQLCESITTSFGRFAVPLIKKLCWIHMMLTFEEWFIIAKLRFKELDMEQRMVLKNTEQMMP
jgi:hypothetical protein